MGDKYLEAIEQELHTIIDETMLPLQGTRLYAEFLTMFRYHLGWTDAQGHPIPADPGKRLRPLLCLLSCEAAGSDSKERMDAWRVAVPAAAAIELVHNFSLIHDDIQDNSAERRGRAALWSVWGMAQGINAGDAMFVLARLALDRLQDQVAPATYASVHRQFDAATLALTQGQFLDISFEGRNQVTKQDYISMVQGKTAALLAASVAIGARIATDDTRLVQALAQYGENLGIAFQIVDDILGIWGDPAVTGKSAASDILAKKKSLPILMAWQLDTRGELVALFAKPTLTRQDVEQALHVLDGVHARDLVQAEADRYLDRALEALEATGQDNPAIRRLRELACQAARRNK